MERGHARSRLSAREPCRSPRMPRAPSSPEWTRGRRKVVREGAGQAVVTGEGAGWRVRRRRLPGPRSPPGPEPAVRTLPGRGARASRGRARRAAAGKEVGAAPRDARASFMNAPCRVGCQGTGRPTGIPGTVKTWPRGARGGPWHARAAVVARHGSVPYRFIDKPGECRCPDCGQCPCFSQHVSNVCACCRAGLHDRTCGPLPVRLVKADKWPQTTQATPERPHSGVFASERCQT